MPSLRNVYPARRIVTVDGLSLRGDELLIKAREAMIAAVHTFNSAGLTFRAELFIVTAIIAWTCLLHALVQTRRHRLPLHQDRERGESCRQDR